MQPGMRMRPSMTSHHSPGLGRWSGLLGLLICGCSWCCCRQLTPDPDPSPMDFHLIANFAALALITLAGPAVIFILFYRRGAL